MNKTEKYTTVIQLNSEQAKKEIDELKIKTENLRKEQEKYTKTSKKYEILEKQIRKNNKQIELMGSHMTMVNETLQNMSTVKPQQLRDTIKDLNKLLSSDNMVRGSEEWNRLTEALKEAKTELQSINGETKASQSLWSRFTKFLNDSWGGLTMLLGSIAGISMTIRRTVADFAKMEEEMANVRKYTGMAEDQVHDLNEEFKTIDTRTSREELNQLAGAAGRLGKTSRKDILEFVEAGNMIKVALGDDLGDGAIDKVGKLAMAFGEDDKKGLKGAMLATGSAINELAQNSSAQAGYLVDFTARVAGFGKQLGLTQAQIMGFGAVMDENLLRDEMAATAFGNMLTKMQTDTAKFAKIAGMNVSQFTKLLNEDANSAIIALAENLKKADPQSMMKMLDDMGLDGNRAVGVLSTMADKIDDVRERQELATEAYRKATSVEDEYKRMNETVEAQIEKEKKKFHEISVTLGQQLLPVVKYTISWSSILVKVLSSLISFVSAYIKELLSIVSLIVIYNAATIKTIALKKIEMALDQAAIILTRSLTFSKQLLKNALVALQATWALLTKGMRGYIVVMRAARIASLTNPWTALATVLTGVGIAIYSLVKAWKSHREELRMQDPVYRAAKQHLKDMSDITKKANGDIASEIAEITHLTNIIRSNSYSINDRRKAITRLQSIVPDYHASITNEGKLIEDNTSKLTDYINELKRAAKTQAYMDKLSEIAQEKLDNELVLSRKRNNLKAVDAELERGERKGDKNPYKSKPTEIPLGDGMGSITHESNQKRTNKLKERAIQEKAVNDALEKRVEIKRREAELEKAMKKDGIIVPDTETKHKDLKDPKIPTVPTYKTDKESDKEEEERKRILEERAKAAKAEYQAELAEKMLAYRQGITTYTYYMEERHQITQNYYDEMKRIYGEDSTEYKQLLDDREKMESEYMQWTAKRKEDQLIRDRLWRERSLRRQFEDEKSDIYHNEDALHDALFRSEITYLRQRQKLYKEGSREWMDLKMQIQDKDEQEKFDREQRFLQRLAKLREEAGMKNYDELMKIELKGLEVIKNTLIAAGRMTEDEYKQIEANIKRKYEELKAGVTESNDIGKKGESALELAKKNTNVRDYGAGNDAATGIYYIKSTIENHRLLKEELDRLEKESVITHAECEEAKKQASLQAMQQIVSGAQAAYNSINQILSAASALAQANSDLEVARINQNYDKQIAAAGKNEKKKKKLEEQRDKEIAAAKTKANKKAMAIELAQAVASTAMAAINAYSSAAQVPLIGYILGPIAAAMALASGAIQIATIKKQHQVEAMGYYEGGFTGGKRYRREAGVVHEGEFVANHQAVQNPAVLPFLNFLDQAQRNNTVGSLTMQDVSRAAGGGTATVVAPVVNVQTDNSELQDTLTEAREVIGRLSTQLENGIGVDIPIAGENGVYRKIKQYENLLKNK